jgi:ABC-type sulfate transport system permease component
VDGASPWQVFWHVALPQAWRGILSGALLMWARGISEFGAVVILAYHPRSCRCWSSSVQRFRLAARSPWR